MSTTTHRFHRVPFRIKTFEGQGLGVAKIMPTIQRFHRVPYSIKTFEENEPIIRRPGPAMQANAPPPSTARAPEEALSLHPKAHFAHHLLTISSGVFFLRLFVVDSSCSLLSCRKDSSPFFERRFKVESFLCLYVEQIPSRIPHCCSEEIGYSWYCPSKLRTVSDGWRRLVISHQERGSPWQVETHCCVIQHLNPTESTSNYI